MKRITLKKIAVISIIVFALALGGILQTATVDAATGNYWRHHPRPTPTSTSKPTQTSTTTPTLKSTPTPIPSPTQSLAPLPTASPTTSPTPSPSPQASIRVYSDQACTTALSSINWGSLSPGTTSTLVLYIRNQGNTAVTLSKALSNWNPSTLSTYLTLNWDYSNQALSPSATMQVMLSLVVSPSISAITNFGFGTTITATG